MVNSTFTFFRHETADNFEGLSLSFQSLKFCLFNLLPFLRFLLFRFKFHLSFFFVFFLLELNFFGLLALKSPLFSHLFVKRVKEPIR